MRVQLHRRAGVLDNQAGVLQSDERDEQADAGGNAVFEAGADGVENQFAQADERENQEQHAGNEHHAECDLPAIGEARSGCRRDRGKNEKEVFPHAGRLGDGITRVKSHDGGGQRRREARGGHDGPEVHAGGLAEHHAGQDGRLHDDDVGHREKGGDTGQQFRAHRGLVFRQAKNSIKHGFCPRSLAAAPDDATQKLRLRLKFSRSNLNFALTTTAK